MNREWATHDNQALPPGEGLDDSVKRVDLNTFLTTVYPPVEDIISPIFQERGSTLMHGSTGVGKTQFVIGLSMAIATGGRFIDYECEKARSVVLVDFESQAGSLQKRLAQAMKVVGKTPVKPYGVITPDLIYPTPMPNLSDPEQRIRLDASIRGYEVVIIDNISTSFRSLRENEAEGWQEMADWIMRLRGEGQSVILIQHEGKNTANGARGHSKQNDIQDCIVQLKTTNDPDEDVLRFDLHVTKCRHHEKPRDKGVRMEVIGGIPEWSVVNLKIDRQNEAAELIDTGMHYNDVAKEVGVDKATIYRWFPKKKSKPL